MFFCQLWENKVSRCIKSPLSLISPERLAVRVCVLEAHLFQLAATVQLIVPSVSLLSQVLHVHTEQHLPQLHKITVVFILHCRGQNTFQSDKPAQVGSSRLNKQLFNNENTWPINPVHSPCTDPQGYSLAFTILLPTLTSSTLPTTAKGRCVCNREF